MPRPFDKLRLRIRSLLRPNHVDGDLARELSAHIEEETAANVAAGMSEPEARTAAMRAFGSRAAVEEACRDMRRVRIVSNLVQDVRYALRAFGHQPGFFASAVLSMSLGIGATLTIVSLANSLLLAAPTADDAGRLVTIRMDNGSHVSYRSWRALSQSQALQGIAGSRFEQNVNWRNGDDSDTLMPLLVTANFFDVVRVPVALGRGFTAAEAQAEDDPRLVVVSHAFWQRRLNGDPRVIGRTLTINGQSYTVTGVLPDGLHAVTGFGIAPELYLPLSRGLYPSLDAPRSGAAQLIGRLRPDQTVEAGRAALQAAVAHLPETPTGPEFKSVRVFQRVGGFAQSAELRGVGAFFMVLAAMSALVLAIACANVAGLLLARGVTRRREISMRLALGASRGRLIQQLLTESLVVSTAGAAGGALLTALAFGALSRVELPVPIPIELHFSLDWRTIAIAVGVVLAAACATGLLPALRTTKPGLVGAMKMAEAGMGRRLTLRGALLAGQVAVATVLLVAALLFTRSLVRAAGVDPGFDVDRLVVAQVSFVEGRQGEPAHPSIERIVDRVRAIPGVAAAAFSGGVPLTPISGSTRGTEVRIEGRTELIRVEYDGNGVGPGYFEAMGIRVLRGRPFGPADRAGAAAVVVINESFARRYFPGEDPIGQRWSDPDRAGSTVEIVGVVADSKYRTLAETGRPAMYEPALASRTPARTSNLIVRSAGSPGALGPEIRRAVLGEDDSASVVITPMRDAIAFAVLPSRMGSIFLGVMGTLGVALAMVGLLGVVSFAVSRRTPEIALRMALGASRTSVVKLVVLGAGSLVLTGLALGLVLAWLITAPLAAFLVAGLSATDPVTFGAAAILLLAVSLAAVWGPVRRATNIAPAIALKAE